MKADLNKIKAALQQLEQNPNISKSPTLTTSNQDTTASPLEPTCEAAPDISKPIPPLQPNRKAPTLPTFNSSSEEKAVEKVPSLEISLPPTLMQELQQVVQQIENLYREGPIVDGWLESYPCDSTPSNDEYPINDAATSLEYVKAAGSLEKDKVICEAPRSCYRLNGVSKGQQWSYPCPIEQLPSVSVAIARYEKLLQLIGRKQALETHLK
ncbi:hypothetical protein [Synechocystis sp. PCC 7509]|uniref:hypothetical protein n=1 Tax=Synechocystis sp. PCC 7509 TaxID=927677 RepID=UPI0002AC662D|nr:hypothetical protein [Synechocystis sp. PCC 7509]